jgi:predicted hotdog family 3-hydroxylacyl-ACP dehydratase
MTPAQRSFPPIEELLPHRGIMLWLQSVTAADDTGIEAHATVPAEAWCLDADGAMPAWMGIELMAQAIAAHAGLRGRLLGKPTRPGVLLGTRSYRADSPSFPAGARLLVSARIASADESGFGAYECSIRGPAGPLASATLKIFAPEDFAAFLQSAQ